MKLWKKIATVLMSVVLCLPTLAACNGGGNDEFDEEGNRVVRIMTHVAETSAEGIAYARRAEAFNEAHKADKIVARIVPEPRKEGATGNETALTTKIMDKTIPDIISFDAPNAWSYAEAGILIPMDDYISSETLADIPEVSRNTYQDKLYGLPIQESSAGIYYNKEIFSSAGVYDEVKDMTVDNRWTFDEFEEICKKIKNTTGKLPIDIRLDATGDEMATYLLYPFILTSGGKFLSDDGLTADGYLNSDNSVNGFKFLRRLVDKEYTKYNIDGQGFFKGDIAMYLSSGWTIPDIEKTWTGSDKTFKSRDSWGILPYPKASSTATAASPTASWSFGMANIDRGSREAVAKVLEWMVSSESSTAITNATGLIPARTTAVQRADYKAGSPEKMLYDQLIKSGIQRPNTVGYPQFSQSFRDIIRALNSDGMNESGVKAKVDANTANLENELAPFKK